MADVTIESIAIEITAAADSADKALEQLSKNLETLKNVCASGLEGANKVAKGLQKIAAAAHDFDSVDGSKIQSVAAALQSLQNIGNAPDLTKFARSIQSIATAASTINGTDMSMFAANMQSFVTAVQPLSALSGMGDISRAINALKNLPKVADGLSRMNMGTFAQQMQQITSAVQPFVTQMQNLSSSFANMPAPVQQAITAMMNFNTSVRNTNNNTTQLGKALKLANFTAMYFAVRKVVNVLGQFITASNEYVENLNLFTVTMGEAVDEALKFANTVNEVMGIDISQWIKNQGVFKQMTSGFGMVEEKANLVSKNLTQLGYDISSYFNVSVEDSMQKLQAGLSGEIEPLRRLGYALDASTLQQVAHAHGIEMNINNMSQAQKAQLRYIAIMEQSTNAMGDMARTIESPANQIRILESRIQTLKRAIGDSLMPVVSAALPYVTAFVQILGEFFRDVAEFLGFELPKFDYSNVVTKGNEDIASSFDEATKASKEFKGTLASIDQLNIIGTKTEKGSGTGNLFGADLDLQLPSYDFLGNLKAETSKAYDEMKKILPVIGAITTGLIGLKISKSPLFAQLTELATQATPLGKVAESVKGIVGGLLAGGTSGILLHSGIKNLISGEGKLGMNIAETVAGGLVGGVAITKFVKAGNKWGAALTAGLASYGIVSGILKGISENIQKANQEIMDSAIYNNGGAKITEIADAFEEWAAAGKKVNDEFIGKYAALDEYDTKIGELKSTMEEVTGIDLKLDEITPADAKKLKEPFNQLAEYLKTEFKEQVTLAAQSVEDAIKNLDLGGTLSAEMQGAFKTMQRQMDDSYSQVQSSVDEYLDRISKGEKLSDTDMIDFTKKYNYMFEVDNQEDKGMQNLKRTLSEIDMSKIDIENEGYALESIEKIKTASTEYVQSAKDRLQAELDNIAELRRKTQLAYDNRDVTDMTLDQYNQQMDLLNLSENLLGMNFQKQIQDVRGEVERFTNGINSTLAAGTEGTKADWNEWLAAFFTNDLDNLDEIAKGSALRKSKAYNAMQDLDLTAMYDWKTDLEIHKIFANETYAQQWEIIQGEKNPDLELEIGRIQDESGNFKYIVGTEQSLIDAKVKEIKSESDGWKILTGEKTAQIKAELANSPFTMEYKEKLSAGNMPKYTAEDVYKAANGAWGGAWAVIHNTANPVRNDGADPESVQNVTNAATAGLEMVANFAIYNVTELEGDTVAESVTRTQQRQMVYSNGR